MGIFRRGVISGARVMLLAVVVTGCAEIRLDRMFAVSGDDWTMLGGSVGRLNKSAAHLQVPLKKMWNYDPGAGVSAQLLVRDSVLLVSTLKGEVHAVNVLDGKKLGVLSLGAPVAGTPVLVGGTIIVPLSRENESLIAVNLQSGERLWTRDAGPVESAPLVLDSRVYVTTLNGAALCFNDSDGAELWSFRTRPGKDRRAIRSSPATDGSALFFGCDDGFVYAVDLRTGALRWKRDAGGSVFASPLVADSMVIVGTLRGELLALRTDSGTVRWRFDTGAKIYNASAADGARVFVGTSDGSCMALDAATGSRLWTFRASNGIGCTPLVLDSLVLVGSLDKTLSVLNRTDGREVWQWKAEGRIRVTPAVWHEQVFLFSDDRALTAFRMGGD